jgi:hypothetical protein
MSHSKTGRDANWHPRRCQQLYLGSQMIRVWDFRVPQEGAGCLGSRHPHTNQDYLCKVVHSGSKVWIWTVDEKLTTGVDNGKETVKA